MKKVSVCIPAYNAEKYIAAALDSVLAQTYPSIEVVVVNDGSNDGTAGILKNYESESVTIIHQLNAGQCAAANTAFKNATGELIKFFDADDILSPVFIARQVEKLQENKDVIASASWGRFYGDDTSTFTLQNEEVYRDLLPIDWLVSSMKEGLNMMQCGLWLIPREVLHKSGLWNERLSLINDFDFFIRVILASKGVLFAEDATLYYRSGIENSLSGRKSRKGMESAYQSINLGIDRILIQEDSPRTRRICADALQQWKYQFYPEHFDLYKKAEMRVAELGGSRVKFPSGGYTKLTTQLLGWKMTKKLKQVLK